MATASLLELNIDSILRKVERLAKVKLPKDVIEVSLEPKLNVLCIRFGKPTKSEFGEPVHPGIHLFVDTDTEKITALEIINPEKIAGISAHKSTVVR
jgi:hypothetical protein